MEDDGVRCYSCTVATESNYKDEAADHDKHAAEPYYSEDREAGKTCTCPCSPPTLSRNELWRFRRFIAMFTNDKD